MTREAIMINRVQSYDARAARKIFSRDESRE